MKRMTAEQAVEILSRLENKGFILQEEFAELKSFIKRNLTPAACDEREALLKALHDAIDSPKGIVPDSATRFYDPWRY